MWAKQSTAATLIVGPILDSAGAEYASAAIGDLSISKNGGTLTALAAAATLTYISNGQYTLIMTTGNLDTLGRLQITCNKSTYQMPPIGLNIVPAMVFDSLVLGSDRLDANVTHVADTAQTARDIGGNVDVAVSTRSTFAGGAVSSVTGNVGGNVVGSVGSVVGAVALDSAARVKLDASQPDYAPLLSSGYTAPLTAATTRTALGMSAADLDTQLDAILAAASAGAGTGARTVTITVNDGNTVLQNAVVRFTEGLNTYRALTNASGIAAFNLDDATYTLAISKVGYYYAGTTMIVNGTETATYSMSAINVTPGTGDLTTGYLTCLDEDGVAEQGVAVRCQVVQIPASGTGFAYDSAVQLENSAADGLVEFPMIKGARYLVWRGSIKPPAGITPVLISASAGSTTALGSLIGE